MTDTEAAASWRCEVCLVDNNATASKCIACETSRVAEVYTGPPIVFGGGAPAPIDVSKPPTLISSTTLTSTGPATPPPSAAAGGVPTMMTFCKAMTTPVSRHEPVFLEGCTTEDLIDKSECLGTLKVQPGHLLTWGCGECEQLPIKSDLLDEYHGLLKPAPIRAFQDNSVVMICCGSLSSYALRTNNEVWSWGCADNGPLGRPVKGAVDNAWTDVPPPTEDTRVVSGKVPERVWGLPSDDKIVKIVAGDSHAGVLTDSGDVYMWGHYRDFTGPLGFWSASGEIVSSQWVPRKLEIPGVALDIASGENHTIILIESAEKRSLVVMGSNEFGQLCTLPSAPALPVEVGGSASLIPDQKLSVLTPAEITPETYQDIRRHYLKPHCIPVESLEFLRLARSGDVNEFESMPQAGLLHATDLKVTKVCTGSATTFLKVLADGESYWFACGRGCYGELGGGYVEQAVYKPTLVTMPNLCAFDSVVGGDFATFALASDGSVWAWGKGELCGFGSTAPGGSQAGILVPKAIPGLRNKIHSLGCGMKSTYAISHAGYLLVWGEGNNYQLGIGSLVDAVSVPTRVPQAFFEDAAVVAVAAGATHAVALTNASLERRGVKRIRTDEPDELPSLIKKSRNYEPLGDVQSSLVERPSLMFLPSLPGSPAPPVDRQKSPEHAALDKTPGFPPADSAARAAGSSNASAPTDEEQIRDASRLLGQALETIVESSKSSTTSVPDGNQRPTLVLPPSVEAPAKDDVAESPSAGAVESEVLRGDESNEDAQMVESTSELGGENGAGETASGEPSMEERTPQEKPVELPSHLTSVSKPRDSLTAVLISADRPYDYTPKPSQGDAEPMRETEEAADEATQPEATGEEAREEEAAALSTKVRAKAKAKPKAKSKAKAKAKGRPGRKPAAKPEDAVGGPAAGSAEEEPVEEPVKRTRRARSTRPAKKDEDSVSSVIDSGDEEVAKKPAASRGRSKAKAKAGTKKK